MAKSDGSLMEGDINRLKFDNSCEYELLCTNEKLTCSQCGDDLTEKDICRGCRPLPTLVKTTFGQLVAGDKFTLSSTPSKHINVKMDGFAVYRGKDGKTIEQWNEELPFNVIAMEDGRPRTFRDDNTVYKLEEEEA